ncbi:uncharacterized protein LOC124266011 [Haliotis rubra]|uniref:uncharacterized protein LOC124266011 n=1 Tax=Haliotis rubra TaxID=36100 RepID=UPI001EE58460|nr:uncharacterized protein LOC124266011 [Haliotis rubra]
MLLYVEDKAFPHKTFVVVVKGEEKVARVRAQLLHILYNIGKETHQFRLRHNGQFLRDAHTLDQYDIVDNSVIKMVPMSKKPEASFDTISMTSSTVNLEFSPGQPPNVKRALYSEIKHLDWRERILNDFKPKGVSPVAAVCHLRMRHLKQMDSVHTLRGWRLWLASARRLASGRGMPGVCVQGLWRGSAPNLSLGSGVGVSAVRGVRRLRVSASRLLATLRCKTSLIEDRFEEAMEEDEVREEFSMPLVSSSDLVFLGARLRQRDSLLSPDQVHQSPESCVTISPEFPRDLGSSDLAPVARQHGGSSGHRFEGLRMRPIQQALARMWSPHPGRNIFCCCAGIVSLTFTAVALYLAAAQWITVIGHGCAEFVDECSHQKVYTAVFFSVQALLVLVSGILAWVLLVNFKLEMGDRIEKNLIQERDIDQVILAAKDGKLNEKRQASSELAIMAAANDDNKFRIVAEGGLDILMSLSLQLDESTQEHALEAITELLTIPSIQDTFVNMGNVSKLTALLHSQSPRVMQAAAATISTIVNQSEENKSVIIADHGLEDLAHAACNGTIACQQSVASIFNELAINSDIRAQLTARNIPAQALTELCRSNDSDTLRDALQALELMAIESAETICAQGDLLQLLLQLPFRSMDERNYLLVAKILIYYAENKETCQQLLDQENVRDALEQFVKTREPRLQRVVARIITCMMDTQQLKCRAKEVKMNKVLEYIRNHAADRDTWDEADQALQMMNSDDLGNQSTVSNKPKLEVKDSFGSRTSMGSIKKRPASASSGAESDKGLA